MWKPFDDSNSFICFGNFYINILSKTSWFVHQDTNQDVFDMTYAQTGTVLKVVVGWLILLVFLENIVSCVCLDKSGLWLNLVEH